MSPCSVFGNHSSIYLLAIPGNSTCNSSVHAFATSDLRLKEEKIRTCAASVHISRDEPDWDSKGVKNRQIDGNKERKLRLGELVFLLEEPQHSETVSMFSR